MRDRISATSLSRSQKHSKRLLLISSAALALIAAPPTAQAVTINSGVDIDGSLETGWSSGLGPVARQSLHPTGPGNGATSPVTPGGYMFLGEPLTASLSAMGLSAIVSVSTLPAVELNGQQLLHYRTTLGATTGDYYGKSISTPLYASIYFSGGASNQIYYGLHIVETTSGGGGTGYSHLLQTGFNDTFSLNTTASSLDESYFGVTTVKTWQGGNGVASQDGTGFVGLYFHSGVGHDSNGTGPGEVVTYDLYVALSPTPFNTMPAVPEPGTWTLMLAGGASLAGALRRNRAA